jgi:mRNA interferase RelE/StbE
LTTPPYSLRVPSSIAKLIRNMHPHIKMKVKAGLRAIAVDPFAGKALREDLRELRSFRVSRFRIIYSLSGKTVEIVAVGPRRTIYEETLKQIKRTSKKRETE